MKKVILGRKYRHIVHNVEGIVTSVTRHTTGMNVACLEYMKDGEVKSVYFELIMIQLVKAKPDEKFPKTDEPINTRFKLGKVYTEKVHGIKGVATSIASYLTGCARVCLQYVEDGEVYEPSFDINMLEEVKVKRDSKGGPRPTQPSMNS